MRTLDLSIVAMPMLYGPCKLQAPGVGWGGSEGVTQIVHVYSLTKEDVQLGPKMEI